MNNIHGSTVRGDCPVIVTLGSASVSWAKWGNIPLLPGGHVAVDRPALSVLLSRAGTKLLFRFTDDARSRLDRLCLEPPSGPKVTAIRPRPHILR